MPEKKETITVGGKDASSLLAIAAGAMEKLNWNTKYAGENILVAYTPRRWNVWDLEITIETADNQLTITSKQIHNEAFDMAGRNKKRIAEFLKAFNEVKPGATDTKIEEWTNKINGLQQETVVAAQEEVKQAEEINKVMNLSTGNLYATYGIIGINVLVYLAMVFSGINFFSPQSLDVLKWGGNLSALSLGGEPWRLFTCMFLHFGILHLALNMYALFTASVYLEPMLGKSRFLTAYICTGLLASLVSTIVLKEKYTVAAGASGAVFGMYGVFLALLTTNIIPKHIRNTMLQSTLIFVAYNVFYGFKPGSGIDNAAHLGGLISGLVVGYIYFLGFKNPVSYKPAMLTAIVAVATAAALYFVLNNEKQTPVKVDFKSGKIFPAGESMFEATFIEFAALEEKATAPDSDTSLTDEGYLEKLEKISVPAWNEAKILLNETDLETFTDKEKNKMAKLKEYVNMRISLTNLNIKRAKEKTEKYNAEISDWVEKINKQVKSLDEE